MADISFSERAWEEFQYWMGQDKKTVKRITALLKDISRSPFEGIGKPEPLVGEKGKWSRRINGADRQNYGKNHGTGGKERIQGSESITEGG